TAKRCCCLPFRQHRNDPGRQPRGYLRWRLDLAGGYDDCLCGANSGWCCLAYPPWPECSLNLASQWFSFGVLTLAWIRLEADRWALLWHQEGGTPHLAF